VGYVRCLVKVYAVVVSPSLHKVRQASTRVDGRPSKYHRTKGVYLHRGRPLHDVACRDVRWARVSIPGSKYDSRKAAYDVKGCETTNDGNR
jgi:hypothetical protein